MAQPVLIRTVPSHVAKRSAPHEGRRQGHRLFEQGPAQRADRGQPVLAALPDARQLGRVNYAVGRKRGKKRPPKRGGKKKKGGRGSPPKISSPASSSSTASQT